MEPNFNNRLPVSSVFTMSLRYSYYPVSKKKKKSMRIYYAFMIVSSQKTRVQDWAVLVAI